MALPAISLDDKYTLESGRIYLTGTQALIRLPMMQRQRDVAAGLNTGCYISGYRGSPLGGFDQGLWAARKFLKQNHIVFQAGVNEDLAATAVWGTQSVNLFQGARYDGVFGIWYGKGPGVDRSGDVLKHANAAGTALNGGVLALAGDDHASKSSTFPHQSEQAFIAAMMPVLSPAGVQDFLDMGLLGFAMSRYSGCWTAFKCIAETVDSSASVHVDPHRIQVALPGDFILPPDGVQLRWPDAPLPQEQRLVEVKIPAAIAFARANGIDKVGLASDRPRLGIVSTGKSYLDVLQALEDLGISDRQAAEMGISIYKVGMVWPLEPEGIRRFADGLQEILVVEEKRALLEDQVKQHLYNLPADRRPRVIGKTDESGAMLMSSVAELSVTQIAQAIHSRLSRMVPANSPGADNIARRLAFLTSQEKLKLQKAPVERTPYFCSGCPHNTSTRVPEGSRAMAGIGCHFMAVWMDRNTSLFTHMGGEGAPWIGQAPFTDEQHVFANLGDGTYYHSGLMAIRAAVASGVNMTYKILFNDAVAMTGGQRHDGPLTPSTIAYQVAAEGVTRIIVASDEPEKYAEAKVAFPAFTTIEHRENLEAVQKELREVKGVSVLIYDQTCAAEKRRRRKRKVMVDPPKRTFINELVCEACGDCSRTSNCVSVTPVETEFGRKRQIDQSSCNKDFSCVEGFCPSFVTVHGGQLRKPKPLSRSSSPADHGDTIPLAEPAMPVLDVPYSILVTGVGGTGVVTIGGILAMAAHIEGKGCTTLDQTGLAQKGGAVTSHIRLAPSPEDIHAVRIGAGGADLILGCDLLVAASGEVVSKMTPGRTRAVINTHETITGEFTRNPQWRIPGQEMIDIVRRACGANSDAGPVDAIEATRIATGLMGDSIATNLFMLGYAYQKGTIPVSADAILQAIELNGAAVPMNTAAFNWGRRAALDLPAVEAAAKPPAEVVPLKPSVDHRQISESLDEVVARRVSYLRDYQDAKYAARYQALVDRVLAAERDRAKGMTGLTEAVARAAFRLMRYKDEYEVARLYTEGTWMKQLKETFEGDYKLHFHLAPPAFSRRNPENGHLRKQEMGPWVLRAFKVLAKMKGLRGTAFDFFGYTAERKAERRLIEDYFATVDELLSNLTHDNHALAVEIAQIPELIRGYGHIKEGNLVEAKAKEKALLETFRNPAAYAAAAAE